MESEKGGLHPFAVLDKKLELVASLRQPVEEQMSKRIGTVENEGKLQVWTEAATVSRSDDTLDNHR